jgi:hypothetical protein
VGASLLAMATCQPTNPSRMHRLSVGAAEGCDLLIFIFKNQDQKIAAFGSSYAVV